MPPKRAMTDEERSAMVKKMDDDLEEFISSRIKANEGKQEPYDFNKICEDLDNHPAFMKEYDPTKPMTPELEALISLKYESGDATETATNYKDDGNHNFKISKYKWAIDNYTVAIQAKSPEKLLNAQCYTNRAAAHYRIGNYRSSFTDCIFARKFVPDHMKAIIRGSWATFKMSKFDIALRWIEHGLLMEPDHPELNQLRMDCEQGKKSQDRDRRKEQAAERKLLKQKQALYEAIKTRGISLLGVHGEEFDKEEDVGDEFESLFGKTSNTEAANARVFIDDYGTLHWPVLFMYPEYGQTDMISQANETTRLSDLIYQMFGDETPSPDWDLRKTYKPDNLLIYFEDRKTESLYQVEPEATIQSLLSHREYTVYGGLPTLLALTKNSPFTTDFLSKYSLK